MTRAHKGKIRQRIALLFPIAVVLQLSPARADGWLVQQSLQTERRAWTAEYDVRELPDRILVDLRISLLPSDSVSRVVLEQRIPAWKGAIQESWNNRFLISIDGRELPLEIRVRFTHHDPHHRVIIRPGAWQPNQHNWYVDTPPQVVAHEIGHMLGAYDEYRGGALDPKTGLIDVDSLMGASRPGSAAHPRHLWLLRKQLAARLDADVTVRWSQR